MFYPPAAVERAMTIREVMLRAMSGGIAWIHAAEILGFSLAPSAAGGSASILSAGP